MAEFPRKIPVSPPDINMETKPIANSIGTLSLKLPRYRVPIQLNTFTADGTAIINVKTTKKLEINGLTPAINIWCAHTIKDKNAMANIEKTMALYPKIGFRECTDITSDTKPIAGKTMIYTSGCPKNQKRCWYKIGDPPT